MKTVTLSAEMNLKERNAASYAVISELEDKESFRSIEELTPEKLKQSMQAALNIINTDGEIKVEVVNITLDHERNLIIIEQIFKPSIEVDIL